MTDQELARLLRQLPDEDFKDIAALHGAGSIQRQARARFNRLLSEPFVIIALAAPLCVALYMLGLVLTIIVFEPQPPLVTVLIIAGVIVAGAAVVWLLRVLFRAVGWCK